MDENVENTSPNDQTPQEPTTPPTEQNEANTSQTSEVSQNAKNMALLCHLLGLFTSFITPLIIWLLKKDEDSFVDDQGKEALNFQITVLLAGIISAVLVPVFCLGALLATVVSILDIVFAIMGTVKASKGEAYRYPICIRLVK